MLTPDDKIESLEAGMIEAIPKAFWDRAANTVSYASVSLKYLFLACRKKQNKYVYRMIFFYSGIDLDRLLPVLPFAVYTSLVLENAKALIK